MSRTHPMGRRLRVADAASVAITDMLQRPSPLGPRIDAQNAEDAANAKVMLVDAICGAEFAITDEIALTVDGESLTRHVDDAWEWDREALSRCSTDELGRLYAHIKERK